MLPLKLPINLLGCLNGPVRQGGFNVERITLNIGGMTCSACAARVERALGAVPGAAKVRVSLLSKEARVDYDASQASRADFVHAVRRAGYEVTAAPQHRLSAAQVAAIVLAAIALWLVANAFGIDASGTDFPLASSNMGFGMLFIVGVLTSFHCVAMCGGVNLSQCIPAAADTHNSAAKAPRRKVSLSSIRPALLYNSGRVASYTAIGAVVGAVGSALSLSLATRGAIQLAAGVFMLAMALSMLGVVPGIGVIKVRLVEALRSIIPSRASDDATKDTLSSKRPSSKSPLVVGLLSGFMPCGPLQAMQLYALGTGSALLGGASMLCFALGTVPLMLGLGAIAGALSRSFAHKAMTAGACVVMTMGLFMASYGWSLSGLPAISIPNIPQAFASLAQPSTAATGTQCCNSASSSSGCCGSGSTQAQSGCCGSSSGANSKSSSASGQSAIATMQDGVQTVETSLSDGYTPITVYAGTPVKWTISASKSSITGCNRTMEIPEFDIECTFAPGDNVVEFTPTKTGTYSYTCWMGMIRSTITVVEA